MIFKIEIGSKMMMRNMRSLSQGVSCRPSSVASGNLIYWTRDFRFAT